MHARWRSLIIPNNTKDLFEGNFREADDETSFKMADLNEGYNSQAFHNKAQVWGI